jgi:hypothetical protein
MKKRRSDIPRRTGRVERRRFRIYWNIVYAIAYKILTNSSSPRDCVVIASKGGEAVRFQSFRMRVF